MRFLNKVGNFYQGAILDNPLIFLVFFNSRGFYV
jgi:hypothetical protein